MTEKGQRPNAAKLQSVRSPAHTATQEDESGSRDSVRVPGPPPWAKPEGRAGKDTLVLSPLQTDCVHAHTPSPRIPSMPIWELRKEPTVGMVYALFLIRIYVSFKQEVSKGGFPTRRVYLQGERASEQLPVKPPLPEAQGPFAHPA